ncbi:tRNA dihydrouridine synthase DusB [Candidatus Uhrbacteria bacterium RIFOXYA2_FULL_40_9]|nr:MAG: tRNA dihydrouridine synthase DusB [Candidatus Uhrbacteria bacterium RIFOXYA2_FULL_40_9]OGL97020.1 MAG: tRNA dihydrouridine synthase DusB [Candidatus Uhrbacteria bacterium RIFOXYB2_FULL_41_18]
MFSWNTHSKPLIALAPMADMTDSSFCRVVKSLSTTPIIFREMVSSEAIVRENEKTWKMTKIHSQERPVIQQIFGGDPMVMARAATLIEENNHPEGIDINMGCPVHKLTQNFNGAALMKEPEKASKIVKAIKQVISLPVSVKIRTGWSQETECLEFVRVLEEAGADLITIHGRTKTQGYSGKANWDIIRQAKKNVSLPIIANGDITSAELALQALQETECDGITIARGALGNPWIFLQIDELLSGKPLTPVTLEQRVHLVQKHVRLQIENQGEHGIITFRKHLTWYFKGIPGAKQFRERLHTITSLTNLDDLLKEMLNTLAN